MMLQRGLAVLVSLGVIAGMVCCTPTPTPNGNENSANSNSSDNGNSNGSTNANGNSNSSSVILTIQFDVPAPVSSVSVAGFVNKGNVDRSEAGDPIPWDFRDAFIAGNPSGGVHVYPRGTVITLICAESEVISSPSNTGVSPVPVPMAGQFVDWQGDVLGAGGNDAGSLFFTLNESRTITARFAPMHGVVLRWQGGANGTGTSLDTDYLAQAPLTIPPRQTGNSRGTNVVGTGLTGQQGLIGKFHYFRDGTVVKFTVPAGAAFTSWSGDGAISGREITFTFGGRTQIADLNWP